MYYVRNCSKNVISKNRLHFLHWTYIFLLYIIGKIWIMRMAVHLYLTHKGHGIVTSGANDAQAFHNTVPFESFSIRFQSWDWNILQITKENKKQRTQPSKLQATRHMQTLSNREYSINKWVKVAPWCCLGWPQQGLDHFSWFPVVFPLHLCHWAAHLAQAYTEYTGLHLCVYNTTFNYNKSYGSVLAVI